MIEVVKQAKELVEEIDGELLYLSKFGSHLYGLNTSNSDSDYKGIYLPSYKKLLTSVSPENNKTITSKTSGDNTKNTKDDIDIQLWSLQYWLNLVQYGDIGAIDLLYSITNEDAVVFKNSLIMSLFENKDKLYNISSMSAYTQYAIGQAKKYGIRGSRLGIIENIMNFVLSLDETKYIRFGEIIDVILEKFNDSSYCFEKEITTNVGKERSLFICSKIYTATTPFSNVKKRLIAEYEKYGDRSKLAKTNDGIDWKALSHAVRALIQMKILFTNQELKFPFTGKNVDLLKDIKSGKMNYVDVEKIILSYLDELSVLKETVNISEQIDVEFIKQTILNCYGGVLDRI